MPAREAHGRRVAGLPGEHVLRAARVAVLSQRQRDHVRDAGHVAHQGEQRQCVHIRGGAVHDRPVATRAKATRKLPEGVERKPTREVEVERNVAHQRAHGPQRLEVEPGG